MVHILDLQQQALANIQCNHLSNKIEFKGHTKFSRILTIRKKYSHSGTQTRTLGRTIEEKYPQISQTQTHVHTSRQTIILSSQDKIIHKLIHQPPSTTHNSHMTLKFCCKTVQVDCRWSAMLVIYPHVYSVVIGWYQQSFYNTFQSSLIVRGMNLIILH